MDWREMTKNEEREADDAEMVRRHEDDEPKIKRHTTAHDRYQITDSICGLVETATSLKKALERAKRHTCEGVQVFDTMARMDCIQVWNANGNILAYRKAK